MQDSTLFPDSKVLGFVLFAAVGLSASFGCVPAPDRVRWEPTDPLIQPDEKPGAASGTLIVETVLLGTENGRDRRQLYYLYDDQGTYLTHFNNDSMPEIRLRTGCYAVVTNIDMANRKVQVLIREGQTTRIHLNDFKTAPTLN